MVNPTFHSNPPPYLMDAHLDELRRTQTKQYWYAAGAAVAWSDYLLTFDKEVRFLWRGKFHLSKIFFVLARYFALMASVVAFDALYEGSGSALTTRCRAGHYLRNISAGLAIVFSEAILILRTYAIYNCNKKLLASLVIIFVAVVAAEGYILVKDIRRPTDPELENDLRLKDCAASNASQDIFVLEYILILSFETLIAVLTFYRWVKHFRQSPSPLVRSLYRDGMVYYIFLLVLSVVNIIMMKAPSTGQYNNLLAIFQPVLHAAFAARILFSIRATRPISTGSMTETLDMSTLDFAGQESWETRQEDL